MKKFSVLFIVILGLCLFGCGTVPPEFLQSDYENNSVKSIGILELKDNSALNAETEITQEDFKNVENIVIEEVLNRDYDVVAPVQYKGSGINGVEDLTRSKIAEICEKEKVDAVLFPSISRYKDDFLGEHILQMNFKLYKANGDSIWVDKIELDKNGLPTFLLFVAGITVGSFAYPSDVVEPSTSTKLAFGLGAGVLGGLLAEGITNHISDAISERFGTLPEGVGNGKRIK